MEVGLRLPAFDANGDENAVRDQSGDGLPGLLGHFLVNAAAGIRLKAPRVDHDVLVLALLALTVMAVTGQTREICNDGVTRFGQPVEQG